MTEELRATEFSSKVHAAIRMQEIAGRSLSSLAGEIAVRANPSGSAEPPTRAEVDAWLARLRDWRSGKRYPHDVSEVLLALPSLESSGADDDWVDAWQRSSHHASGVNSSRDQSIYGHQHNAARDIVINFFGSTSPRRRSAMVLRRLRTKLEKRRRRFFITASALVAAVSLILTHVTLGGSQVEEGADLPSASTSTGTTAATIDTGVTGLDESARLVLDDDFSRPDAGDWGTNWLVGVDPTRGTGSGAPIRNGVGVLTTSALGNKDPRAAISRKFNIRPSSNAQLAFSFKFDDTESYPVIMIRSNQYVNKTYGYILGFTPTGGYWIVGKTGESASEKRGVYTNAKYRFARHVWYRTKFAISQNRVKLKMWPASEPEPQAWEVDTTDETVHTPGAVGFLVGTGKPAQSANFYFDNVTLHVSS